MKLHELVKAYKKPGKVSPGMIKLSKAAADPNPYIAYAARAEISKALSMPLRDAILHGDLVSDIFERKDTTANSFFQWPKSCFNPENDGNFEAFVRPSYGTIPDRQVVGDYVMVPVFKTANALSISVSYLENANWDVLTALTAQLVNGHVRTKNRLGFETLLAAAVGRNFTVSDSNAAAGLFTKRLITLAMIKMARLGGGNSASLNKRRITDLYFSLEGMGDIRNWDLTQIDDISRREIFIASDDGEALNQIFGINLHAMHEFGENQSYQSYLTRPTAHGGLNASLPAGDLEFALALDNAHKTSFLMPVAKDVEIYPDPVMRRDGKAGWWSEDEYGLAALDNRNTMMLSF